MDNRSAALASLAMARIESAAPETGECLVCGRALAQESAALYWAFTAGQEIAGRNYDEAKREAEALGIVPPCLVTPSSAPAANTPAVVECDMNDGQRAALRSLEVARGLLEVRDSAAALYWAFIAGLRAAGMDYYAAKGEAAELRLVPPCLRD